MCVSLTWSPFHLVGSCTVIPGCGFKFAGGTTAGAAAITGGILQMFTDSGEMPLPVDATSYHGCVCVCRKCFFSAICFEEISGSNQGWRMGSSREAQCGDIMVWRRWYRGSLCMYSRDWQHHFGAMVVKKIMHLLVRVSAWIAYSRAACSTEGTSRELLAVESCWHY